MSFSLQDGLLDHAALPVDGVVVVARGAVQGGLDALVQVLQGDEVLGFLL